jgi:hypothetical protein
MYYKKWILEPKGEAIILKSKPKTNQFIKEDLTQGYFRNLIVLMIDYLIIFFSAQKRWLVIFAGVYRGIVMSKFCNESKQSHP